jgi:hypothetical protein
MLCAAFPSLAKNLTPIAAAHGLKSLTLPTTLKITYLDSASLVQDAFKSLVAMIDSDEQARLCVSLDAEWNISRRLGVSVLQIAPHSSPNTIYIIPVSCEFSLPILADSTLGTQARKIASILLAAFDFQTSLPDRFLDTRGSNTPKEAVQAVARPNLPHH